MATWPCSECGQTVLSGNQGAHECPAVMNTASDQPAAPLTDLEAARGETARMKDAWLRTAADFDKFRQHTREQERQRDLETVAFKSTVQRLSDVLLSTRTLLGAVAKHLPQAEVGGDSLFARAGRQLAAIDEALVNLPEAARRR